jgi:four helix bundle protein
MMKNENIILTKTFEFALNVISFSEELEQLRKYVISKQVLRSGTSIGANVREAQNAESKKDFIHKMKIAAKEAEELEYWFDLCKFSENYPFNENLLLELKVIQKILTKIIGTSKKRAIGTSAN